MSLSSFLKLTPEYRDYVWGGDQLRPGHTPTAEAWVVWEGDRIETGVLAGKTLRAAAAEFGVDLLGSKVFARTQFRFPILVKLLDCAQWLSLQVHPNDEQAKKLEGDGHFGKTEAWHVLGAQPGAKLIAGLKPGVTSAQLAEGIRNGAVEEISQYVSVAQGDTIFMPAGTLHSLGPGLLIYEVQQTSDLTYRVFDWGRPQTEMRRLHIEKSIEVTRPDLTAQVIPVPLCGDGARNSLIQCEYFSLELLSAVSNPIELDTQNETFHAITLIEGKARLQSSGESIELEKFQTVLIPAGLGKYQFQPLGVCRALKASG
ncbi:MAG: class I mannose-6-phosphate isomerase [Chloroflexi bacterium]|nr:class I mannose-6-phosphate isomerase [Chloroflexota bacterium]